jgi:hypothetical protein
MILQKVGGKSPKENILFLFLKYKVFRKRKIGQRFSTFGQIRRPNPKIWAAILYQQYPFD